MLTAEQPGLFETFAAEFCFQATGFIVNARVDDTTVMTGLMKRGARLFIEQQNARIRPAPCQFEAGGGANDAGANDDEMVVQLRLQTDEAFSIGEASTQPSWSTAILFARDSAPLWHM